jgi:hypothetical protein
MNDSLMEKICSHKTVKPPSRVVFLCPGWTVFPREAGAEAETFELGRAFIGSLRMLEIHLKQITPSLLSNFFLSIEGAFYKSKEIKKCLND